jgi:molecular chaperone GrpE
VEPREFEIDESNSGDDLGDVEAIEVSDEAAKLVADLKSELDEAVNARKRALADFVNYQKRAEEDFRRAEQAGVARVIRSMLNVLDQLDLALKQKQASTEQLRSGVQIARDEFAASLQKLGVQRIEPQQGDEFNPQRHEAMLRQPAPGVAPGHVAASYQPGYALHELVLRPAKVAVTPSDQHD